MKATRPLHWFTQILSDDVVLSERDNNISNREVSLDVKGELILFSAGWRLSDKITQNSASSETIKSEINKT